MKVLLTIVIMLLCTGCVNNSSDNVSNTPPKAVSSLHSTDQGIGTGTEYVTDSETNSEIEKITLFSTRVQSLHPYNINNPYLLNYISLCFESLFQPDEKQIPRPLLAKSYEISKNGLIIHIVIKEGIAFHNGKELTAHDVLFSYDQYTLNKGNVYSNFRNVIAIDEKTIEISLFKPDGFIFEKLMFPIIPEGFYTDTNDMPPGTGPYKFSYFDENSLILQKNENWSSITSTKVQKVNEIHVLFGEKASDEFELLNSGAIDAAIISGIEAERYYNLKNFSCYSFPGNCFDFIAINAQKPPFDSPALRKALQLMINKYEIIANISAHAASPSDIPIRPDTWLNNTNTISDPYNPAAAEELLISEGFLRSESGYFERYGYPFNIELLVNSENLLRMDVAKAIKTNMEKLGIGITIKAVPGPEILNLINSGAYELAIIGCSITDIPDISFLYSTASRVQSDNECYNIAGYSNDEGDFLMEQIASSYKREESVNVMWKLRNIINEDVPYIGLYFVNNTLVVRRGIKGIEKAMPRQYKPLGRIEEWHGGD